MSKQEITDAQKRLQEHGPMLAYRFQRDVLCTARKFKAIDNTFNDKETECVRLKTLPGFGHSVLTLDFVDKEGHPTKEALNEVLAYFKEKL